MTYNVDHDHPHPFTSIDANVDGNGEHGVEVSEQGASADVTKKFDLVQFYKELREKSEDAHAILSMHPSGEGPSEDKPAKLFVSGLEQEELDKLLSDHEPREPEEESPEDLVKRFKEGGEVTPDQLQQILRSLL